MEQPDLRPISSSMYQLKADYEVEFVSQGNTYKLKIFRGFVTDGASVPRFLWSFAGITPDGLHRAAALVHDFIYRTAGRMPDDVLYLLREEAFVPCFVQFTRRQADAIFRQLIRKAGGSRRLALMMWLGVRVGGWKPWVKAKRERGA